MQLGLLNGHLKAIKANWPTNHQYCCNRMLDKWVDIDHSAKWEKIDAVIQSLASVYICSYLCVYVHASICVCVCMCLCVWCVLCVLCVVCAVCVCMCVCAFVYLCMHMYVIVFVKFLVLHKNE